jgi:NAD(P)-dependent dehydrogenase (short-subunit alcohol dehydrogenase family)
MTTIKTLMCLRERRAIITGAAGGLGQVMAQTLAEMGADLVLLDRPNTRLPELADKLINDWEGKVVIKHCDLENQEQRDRLIKETREENKLDILINNAAFVGTSGLPGWAVPFEEQTIETWRRAIEVNLTAVFHLCQGMAPILKTSGKGSIINVGSIYGAFGPDWSLYEGTSMSNPAAYAASKGGLLQLTRWLATTLAPDIRVNAISPGGIARSQAKEFVDRYEARTPLKRMAKEDDYRGIVAYLASDMSLYSTGQNYLIDGGWSAW